MERAEDSARLLDVHLHQLLEDSSGVDGLSLSILPSVFGAVLEEYSEVKVLTQRLVFDLDEPTSIASSLKGARENARCIRETISSELWECINSTYTAAGRRAAVIDAASHHGLFGFVRFVKERIALAWGIADMTMSRDEGWYFLILGRSVERADITARLLATNLRLANDSQVDWVTLLRSCSAHESYLRTYRRAVEGEYVLELLLANRIFPRSIYFSLASAENCLAAIAPALEQTTYGGIDPVEPTVYQISGSLIKMMEELENMSFGTAFSNAEENVLELTVSVERVCCAVSTAIARQYFYQEPHQEWRSEKAAFMSSPPNGRPQRQKLLPQ